MGIKLSEKMRRNCEGEGLDYLEEVRELEARMEELEQQLEAADIERDRLWCRALTVTLPSADIERVTKLFNRIRLDTLAPRQGIIPAARQEDEMDEIALIQEAHQKHYIFSQPGDIVRNAFADIGVLLARIEELDNQKAWLLCVIERAGSLQCCGLADMAIHEADCVLNTAETELAKLARPKMADSPGPA